MVRGIDIIAAVASGTGLQLRNVQEIARRVREAGYFAKETRAAASKQASPRHAAALLLGVLADVPASHAGKAVAAATLSSVDDGALKHLDQCARLPALLTPFKRRGHSILDGVQYLIEFAIFWDRDHVRPSHTSISYETFSREATIYLCVEEPFSAPLVDIRLSYHSLSRTEKNDLERTSQVSFKTIDAIAKTFRDGGWTEEMAKRFEGMRRREHA